MPEVTFLVAVNIDDVSVLTETALNINDDLTQSGHDVVSVKPWARPTVQSSVSPFAVPPSPL